MSYVNRPIDDIPPQPGVVTKAVDYHDSVRWGPIISGLVVALATYLVLNAVARSGLVSCQTQVHLDQTQIMLAPV